MLPQTVPRLAGLLTHRAELLAVHVGLHVVFDPGLVVVAEVTDETAPAAVGTPLHGRVDQLVEL